MTQRVAVYAVPGLGSPDPGALLLRQRAEAWLGRSMDGSTPPAAAPQGWQRHEVDALTAHARRYGFHATLKAPFRLTAGSTLDQLERDVARFAAAHDAVSIPDLRVELQGDFFALVPGRPSPALGTLAGALVTGLDAHRAPATPAETARRAPEALSSRQRALLQAWGYPYVLEEFRFHLTLTDRVPPQRRPRVHQTLTGWFAGCLGRAVVVDALVVCTESAPGAPFALRSVHPLRPAPPADRAVPAHDHGRSR